MRDPYEVLGVSRTASQDEIKARFRRLAREVHPDSDPGNPWLEDRFKEVSSAYEFLSNPARRARFDRGEIDAAGNPRRKSQGSAGAQSQQRRRWSGDPFARFYKKKRGEGAAGGGAAGSGAGAEPPKTKGANVTYTVNIDFLEAARGVTRLVNLASGKKLEVKVPPGTRDGQTLRLKGQGMPGLAGGEAGDAHVEVRVEPHPRLTVDGNDIHSEVRVSLAEALLGARIEVETVDGPVAVTVPEGANTGTRLRLRGRGLAGGGAQDRGDHFLKLLVVLPSPPDKDLTAFVRKWAKKNDYPVKR